MIDVHAHFAEEGYAFPEEWEKILNSGVFRVILASDTIAHSLFHREFCKNHDGAFFAAGVHPSEIENFSENDLKVLEEILRDPKCVAVGEIGLDYHYGAEEKEAQKKAFILQLELADRLSLPVQIHSRDACADTLSILEAHKSLLKRGFLMHCYSYGAENIEAFLRLGAYFSFGGVLCFQNARRAVESAKLCPLDRILIETDSPYLSPFRGEKNSPANLPVILEKLSEIKKIEKNELELILEQNAGKLFYKL